MAVWTFCPASDFADLLWVDFLLNDRVNKVMNQNKTKKKQKKIEKMEVVLAWFASKLAASLPATAVQQFNKQHCKYSLCYKAFRAEHGFCLLHHFLLSPNFVIFRHDTTWPG